MSFWNGNEKQDKNDEDTIIDVEDIKRQIRKVNLKIVNLNKRLDRYEEDFQNFIESFQDDESEEGE